MKPASALIAIGLCLAAAPALADEPAARQGPPSEIQSRATPIKATEVVALEHPWAIERMPDGAFLISQKPGMLRIWRDGNLSAPIAGVPKVEFGGQGGLLDVALDPGFADNRIIYLAYTEAAAMCPTRGSASSRTSTTRWSRGSRLRARGWTMAGLAT